MTSTHCLQLLGALASSQNPLEKAERCLQVYKHPSRKRKLETGVNGFHGHLANSHWATELIEVLCTEEPIIEDEKLSL